MTTTTTTLMMAFNSIYTYYVGIYVPAIAAELRAMKYIALNMFAHLKELGHLIYMYKYQQSSSFYMYMDGGIIVGIMLLWYLSGYIIYVLCRQTVVSAVVSAEYADALSIALPTTKPVDVVVVVDTKEDEVIEVETSGESTTGPDSDSDSDYKDDSDSAAEDDSDSAEDDDVLQRLTSLSDQIGDLRVKLEESAKNAAENAWETLVLPQINTQPLPIPEFLIIGYQTITLALATEPMMMTLPIIIQSGISTWHASSLPAMAMPTMNVMTGMMMPSQCPSMVTISLRELMRLPNLKYVEGIDIRQDQLYIFSSHFQMPIQLSFYDGTLANWFDYCSSRQIIMHLPQFAGVNTGNGNTNAATHGPYANTRQRIQNNNNNVYSSGAYFQNNRKKRNINK